MTLEFQPEVLQWARKRARLDVAALAKKMGLIEDRVEEWEESGELTFKQAEKLAQKTHTPIGYLFLPAPPVEKLPITDFRTLKSDELRQPSPELLDVIHQTQRQQDWYREYLISQDAEPLAFIGKATLRTKVTQVSADIRKTIGFSIAQSKATQNWEDALRQTIRAVEAAGILVMKIGYAGSSTKRGLDVHEFRGFALSDEYAPLVFINGKDAPPAQMFTLAHELVHLWLGQSGVSTLEQTFAPEGAKEIELYCNQVAAEFLVPLTDLEKEYNKAVSPLDQVKGLASVYRVSSVVMARRFKDAGYLDWDSYRAFYQKEVDAARAKLKKGKGGDPYATMRSKNSNRFSQALIGNTLEGRTSYSDAFSLLGVKTTKAFKQFASDLQFSP
jgi:Zn-dependent peptidase ImmA (M78 family)